MKFSWWEFFCCVCSRPWLVPVSLPSGRFADQSGQLPSRQLLDEPVLRQVQVQRRHRDQLAVEDRVAVAVGHVLVGLFVSSDLIVGTAAQIYFLNHHRRIKAPTDTNNGGTTRLPRKNVDI